MNIDQLYKFRTVDKYSLSALSNNKLWFSSLDSFNDPFEGSYILNKELPEDLVESSKSIIDWKSREEIGEIEYLEMLRNMDLRDGEFSDSEFIQAIAEYDFNVLVNIIHNSKVVCLSKKDNGKDPVTENLMWSHYADGMRGFCLVFDAEKLARSIYELSGNALRPIEVTYQDRPNTVNLSDFFEKTSIRRDSGEDFVHELTNTIATKSKDWSYENELRLLSMTDTNIHEYSPDSLLELIIGEKMPEDQANIVISAARAAAPHVVMKKASFKKDSYEIEIIDY